MKRALIKIAAVLIPLLTGLSMYFEAHASMQNDCINRVELELAKQEVSAHHELKQLFSADPVDVKLSVAVKCLGADSMTCDSYVQAKINRYMRVIGGLTREQLDIMYWRCM